MIDYRNVDPRLGTMDDFDAMAKAAHEAGIKVIVDPKSLVYIDGTQLDYTREGIQEGFKFNNPNEKDHCGCGKSFSV